VTHHKNTRKHQNRVFSRPFISTYFSNTFNMPTTRRPLGPITLNIIKKKDLSPQSRGKIIGAYIAGARPSEISRLFSTPDSTVRTTILKAPIRPHGYSCPKPGRPIEYSIQDKRSVLRFIRSNRKTKYSAIKKACGLEISHSTIKRILRKNGVTT
jgi:hypothetical protein